MKNTLVVEDDRYAKDFDCRSLIALVMGLIFGYIFRKDKSILTPLILHFYFDWIVELLVA